LRFGDVGVLRRRDTGRVLPANAVTTVHDGDLVELDDNQLPAEARDGSLLLAGSISAVPANAVVGSSSCGESHPDLPLSLEAHGLRSGCVTCRVGRGRAARLARSSIYGSKTHRRIE
jgi:hypothetical protein